MNSIRQRLLLWQITALVVTSVLCSALTYRLAWDAFNRIRDYGLEQIAWSVVRHGVQPAVSTDATQRLPVLPSIPDRPAGVPLDAAADVASGEAVEQPPPPVAAEVPAEVPVEDLGQFVSQIWLEDGELLYSSLDDIGPPLQQPGFHLVQWQDEPWRVYTVVDRHQRVQVAVTSADRASDFAELLPSLVVPLCLLVLVLTLLIHTAVSRALAPLHALGRQIRQHDHPQELPAIETGRLPEELLPLGQALNQLLARVDALLSGQRALLADAAHELNTPLAAIKLQAQLARRATDAQRSLALDELDRGIARATRLVAQLLQMARLEPDVRAQERVPQAVAVDALAAQVVAAFSAQADARGMDLGLVRRDRATVWADPSEMQVLLDNLVDNALRHADAGCRVDLNVTLGEGQVWVEVRDNGPGIASAERERALQRFVRLNPQSGTGSGLGLAIAASIVSQLDGTLELQDTPGGGLTVRIGLPEHHEKTATGVPVAVLDESH
ncbi:HAMP domain-containing sensor histidine kinase [uncultured Hydrogenophaga sp.]|uniref:sensor histidine kinase n=1 Tax=uncultured Hydrogenophaga sp. TaxID=199683 RepID=UPI00265E97A8|nr:HAMP domain-containing sensor histidine kinase [uncultured Hydrogenophaga sp.]